jgi:hypothetical protein
MAFAGVPDPTPDPTPNPVVVFSVSPGLFLPKARTGRLALTTKVFTSLFASYQAKFPYTLFSLGFCRRQSVICPVTFTTPYESCIGTN